MMLKGKKGIIHHPLGAALVAFILGLVVMYLIAINVIPLNLNICGVP